MQCISNVRSYTSDVRVFADVSAGLKKFAEILFILQRYGALKNVQLIWATM